MNGRLRYLTICLAIIVLDANGVALPDDASAPPEEPVTCSPLHPSAPSTYIGLSIYEITVTILEVLERRVRGSNTTIQRPTRVIFLSLHPLTGTVAGVPFSHSPRQSCLSSAVRTRVGGAIVTPMMIVGMTLVALSTVIFIALLIYAIISARELRRLGGSQPRLQGLTREAPYAGVVTAPPSDRAGGNEVVSVYDPTYAEITSDDVTARYVESPSRTRATRGRNQNVSIEPRNLPAVPEMPGPSSKLDPAHGANVYSTIRGDYMNMDADDANSTRTTNTSSRDNQAERVETNRYAVPRKQSVYESISEDENDVTASGNAQINKAGKQMVDNAPTGPRELDDGYEVAQQTSGNVVRDFTSKIDRHESDESYEVALKPITVRDDTATDEQRATDNGYEVPRKGVNSDEYYVSPDDVIKEIVTKGDKRPISDNSVYLFMGKQMASK
ncbi:hypothetical protein LSAT2_020335 [Lamellibrachia satsuma]|nr:hypothetical protein LSAT2_020335 [Lamellibrachia satsuma]